MVKEETSLRTNNLTDHFVHDVRNALFALNQIDGIEWSESDISRCFEIISNIRKQLDSYPQDGLIPKSKITEFLDFVDGLDKKDISALRIVNNKLKDLIQQYNVEG